MIEQFKRAAAEMAAEIAAWRQHFHAHPELSFEEFETTQKVANLLRSFGYTDLRIGVEGKLTGVVAELNANKPGRCIALRADMDALPMDELADRPYASRNKGAMHACGHDAHIAMLLGAAKLLKSVEDRIPGRVRFIFQPSEESPHKSGALSLVTEGVLDGVDAITGIHVWSGIRSGFLGCRPGPMMASADEWTCTIRGKGGHGAMPHEAIDPVVAASAAVGMLQTVVSRRVSPLDTAVVTVGRIDAGTTFNIIPDKAFMQGTVRTFSPAVRKRIPELMERIIRGVCEASECTADFVYSNVLPPTVNDPAFTELAKGVAEQVFGADKVQHADPTMGAEDMSFYLEKVPGTFMFLGVGNEAKGLTAPQHHPHYDVDDDALPAGTALLASVAWRFLSTPKA